jgi:uncharacterized membrane protein
MEVIFMEHVEQSIEVDVPVSTAYNQWTQFEEFPHFMEGVQSVRQLDEKRLHWKAKIAGKEVEWDAQIFEQVPDQRVAWRSVSGPLNSGMVNFQPIGTTRTRVSLKLNYEPEGALQKAGSSMGIVTARVNGDLKRFKDFIERRGAETGAWRGTIEGREMRSGDPADSMPRSKRYYDSGESATHDRSSTEDLKSNS